MCLTLFAALSAASVRAQQATTTAQQQDSASGTIVALAEQPTAFDASGRAALVARLRTTALNGSVDAPVLSVRFIVQNSSATFYAYVSGWVTFYDAEGVRCGEGQFKLDALAANESAEVDAPGIRINCSAVKWRIAAANLLTRANDLAKPDEMLVTAASSEATTTTAMPGAAVRNATTTTAATTATMPQLEISIDGEVHPIQVGNPLEISVGKKRVKIVLQPAPIAP